ncbi:MAG: hypothetical protein LUD02_10520 [Tannerellaceae bacterium]|nr:hypothetical protein [Tannerellaceae bacterium]MCD8264504.1 hypothetical protein [Tannerellaceae bacterium]
MKNNFWKETKKHSGLLVGVATSFTTCLSLPAQEKKQPNILLIMTDQQRADLLQREGYPLNTISWRRPISILPLYLRLLGWNSNCLTEWWKCC